MKFERINGRIKKSKIPKLNVTKKPNQSRNLSYGKDKRGGVLYYKLKGKKNLKFKKNWNLPKNPSNVTEYFALRSCPILSFFFVHICHENPATNNQSSSEI